MRIIFITDTLASGGAERVISVLANNLSMQYDEVEIVCLRKHLVFYDIQPKVKIVFAEDYSNGWVNKILWLRNYIKKDDVVISFMIRVYCVTLLSLLGLKRNIITSERNDPKAVGIKWKIIRSILLPTTTKHVVQTEKIKSYFPSFLQKRISIIYNPINLNQCGEKDWNAKRVSVLAMARLDKQKNYPMMIKAFLKFHEKYPHFILDIWGNRGHDEQLSEVKQMIADNNASAFIKLNGRCNDVAKEYEKAYMFLLTSNFEGFSNSLMEAVCSGVPTISTKVSGATDLLEDGINGFLIDINRDDQLYNAMVTLAEDPKLASNMAKEGKKARCKFEEAKIVSEWSSLINTLLHK